MGLKMKWRTIDTAPHDGTEIMIWDSLGFIAIAYWDRFVSGWYDGEITYTPSHWMSLPPGPHDDSGD